MQNAVFVKLIITLSFILIYYKIIKSLIMNSALFIAKYLNITKYYSLDKAKGVTELPLIAISHAFFCIALIKIFFIDWMQIGLFKFDLAHMFYGFFLGIGVMSVSTLFGQVAVALVNTVFPKYAPKNLNSWLMISKGGWLRHHMQTIDVLPGWIALIIIFIQISSEEIVFRGVVLNYFIAYGNCAAIFISTIFFVLMQLFFMPTLLSAMFPVIGALIMGVVHGILYSQIPELMPLIIAHFTFFVFAVM